MDTLHNTLGVKKEFGLPKNELKTYDIAHHLGLSLAQEYELLCLPKESQRQEYLLRHLRSLLPTLTELNNLTERIKLNGHYRKLSSN